MNVKRERLSWTKIERKLLCDRENMRVTKGYLGEEPLEDN